MNAFRIRTCMAVLFFILHGAAFAGDRNNSQGASLGMQVRGEWVDLYLANRGPNDLDESYRIDGSQLGAEIELVFYAGNKLCRTCKFSDGDDFLYSVPVAKRHGKIFPGEITGISFFADEIAKRYALKQGCYAFFAKFTRRDGGKSLSRNISNVQTLCVRMPARP